MAKKPMSVEAGVLRGDADEEALRTAWDEMTAAPLAEEAEPARARPSPAEEFAKWVAGLEWGAAYSDSVTRLLEEIQKRARALL